MKFCPIHECHAEVFLAVYGHEVSSLILHIVRHLYHSTVIFSQTDTSALPAGISRGQPRS